MDHKKSWRINDMIIDEFELVKENRFIKITSNRNFVKSLKKEFLYNIENSKDNEFEEYIKKTEDPEVVELFYKMKNWLIQNHSDLII